MIKRKLPVPLSTFHTGVVSQGQQSRDHKLNWHLKHIASSLSRAQASVLTRCPLVPKELRCTNFLFKLNIILFIYSFIYFYYKFNTTFYATIQFDSKVSPLFLKQKRLKLTPFKNIHRFCDLIMIRRKASIFVKNCLFNNF